MNIYVPTVVPTITSYPVYASLLTITDLYLQSDYENYMNWYMLQFINTIYFEEQNYIIFDNVLKENTIEYCEIIEREIYNGVQMQEAGIKFTDFFINQLRNGYAIFLRINQKYVSQANMQEDFNHEVLITSYDIQSENFTIWDFFGGKKYDCIQVSRALMEQSMRTFKVLNDPNNSIKDKTSKIIAFRRIQEGLDSKTRYEPKLFSFLIERWLTGDKVGNYCYGRICYSFIKNCIENHVESLDIRGLHILYDHKVALSKTLVYLMNTNKIAYNKELLQEVEKLKELTFVCRNVFLKYKLIGNLKNDLCKSKVMNLVEKIDVLDYKVFVQIYKLMNTDRSFEYAQ